LVLENTATGARDARIMKGTGNYGTANFMGESIFDLSGCTDIRFATVWTNSYITNRKGYGGTNRVQPEFWYGVGNKIYSAALPLNTVGNATAKSTLAFEFSPDETITHMLWTQDANAGSGQPGYIFWDRNPDGSPAYPADDLSTNNMMTVVTYNESTGEGKVYAIPRAFPGTGVLLNSPRSPENEFVFSYGGFGRITAVCLRKV
jgi:hypothetical protein